MSIFNLTKEQLSLKEMGESLLLFEIQERSKILRFDNKVKAAMVLASFLHRDQRRQNRGDLPKDTYITHPYRNTLRLLRWGVTDPDVIVASILHDTLEDCSVQLAQMWRDNAGADMDFIHRDTSDDDLALLFIVENFGPAVAAIVKAVSNPRIDPALALTKDQKHDLYRAHVIEAVSSSTKVALVKLSDFVDNAMGLYHNTGNPAMQHSLARKYLPLLDVFIEIVDSHEIQLALSYQGELNAKKQLLEGRERLTQLASV